MSIPAGFNFNPRFSPNPNSFNGFGPTQRQSFATPSIGGAQSFGTQQLVQMIQVLQQLIQSLSQLTQGWGGLLGGASQQQTQADLGGLGTDPSQAGLYGGQGGTFGNFMLSASQNALYASNPTAGGLYGSSTGSGLSNAPHLPTPSDSNDYASYLQAQLAGGALQGQTSVNQSDGIPGTRFATVQQSQLWQANVARQYSYQFAAYASGNDPLSAQGLKAGAQAMQSMSPDAQLFMQVASVFKGNLLGGPGSYDNPGLKHLLEKTGGADLAGKPGVGETDVQTVGAIAAAMNRGQITLQDVINSGTIDNLDRYKQVINYVQGGHFATDLNSYDNVAV